MFFEYWDPPQVMSQVSAEVALPEDMELAAPYLPG